MSSLTAAHLPSSLALFGREAAFLALKVEELTAQVHLAVVNAFKLDLALSVCSGRCLLCLVCCIYMTATSTVRSTYSKHSRTVQIRRLLSHTVLPQHSCASRATTFWYIESLQALCFSSLVPHGVEVVLN